MTDREAQEIIRMIESNWRFDLGTARGMWRTELMLYDPAIAMKAVTYLAKHLKWQIRLSDLTETLRMFSKTAAREEREAKAIEEGKRGFATPEWVWVWSWARTRRDPPEMRSFPQQIDFVDPTKAMATSDYEALREEWIAAGSPKSAKPLPLERRPL